MSDRTGLPRPLAMPSPRYPEDPPNPQARALPLPWINGTAPAKGEFADFYAFREDCRRAETDRLCCICGDPLRYFVTVGAMGGDRATSGGWGHPRCIHLSVRLCPHFADLTETVAWLHEGDGIGVSLPATFEIDEVLDTARAMDRQDLAWLARTNPWGDAA